MPLGRYFADFYCHAARLVVELDGDQHAEPGRVEADQRRTEFLEAHGYRVLRFSNGDVLTATEAVLTVILEAMAAGSTEEPSP